MRRTIFIGQAMPRVKEKPHDWPSLNVWLSGIGVLPAQIEKYFYYTALVDYFPGAKNGSHIAPSPKQVAEDWPRLIKTLKTFDPEVVVPVGRLSLSCCLGEDVGPLKNYIGRKYLADPYKALGREVVVVPLPHPSGASRWKWQEENGKLLEEALQLLKKSLS